MARHRLRRHRRRRRYHLFVVLLLAAGLIGAEVVHEVIRHGAADPAPAALVRGPDPAAGDEPAAGATATPDPGPPSPDAVRVPVEGFLSWAFLDRRSGRITGSANHTAPSDTMSMVKAWLAADYLRRIPPGETPTEARLDALTRMIRDSDNAAAQDLFAVLGRRRSIERLVETCGLTDSAPYHDAWSNTVVSARDTVRIGLCLADGRAAGDRWTPWLLDEMRRVRGVGDFGIRAALPADLAPQVAIKNGWLLRDEDGLWHIACLAIGPDWVVAALARYPGRLGFEYGTGLCRDVGGQLLVGRVRAAPPPNAP
ncbi:serine hydrolase [Polymorphospora sp. NPDC050346]|uniref:serine hydrolase n=1 Tax=Polymorphospora sp. NPDC050346 TaxID=3155780 RepID=UPI0033C3CC78